MSLWFTADTHFGHEGIIRHCQRPFSSVHEMDRVLIDCWNSVVGPKDDVWHLGDFAFRGAPGHAERVFKRLHGRKRLIIGNHDSTETLRLPWAEQPRQTHEIRVDGQRVWLSHYAHRVWPASHHGSLHLYGHSHASLPGTAASLDVGVDCWAFVPVSLDQIRTRLAATATEVLAV